MCATSPRTTRRRRAATATVQFGLGYPVTRNDPALTERMVPTLKRVAGVTPSSQDPAKAALNHSPLFYADESALPVGVRVMTHLTLDYFYGGPRK